MKNIQELILKYKIPVVKSIPGVLNENFIQSVRKMEDVEGFVIKFFTGNLYKIKTNLYFQLHSVKENLNSENKIIELLINQKLDDLKSILPLDDLKSIEEYEEIFYSSMNKKAMEAKKFIEEIREDNFTRKKYAIHYLTGKEKWISNIVFKLWDNKNITINDIEKLIFDYILKHCNRNSKFAEMRKDTSLFDNIPEREI